MPTKLNENAYRIYSPNSTALDSWMPSAPNMEHDADDGLYWRVWAAQPRYQLEQMIGAEATAEFIATLPARPMARYYRLAERVEQETAPIEYATTDGVFEMFPTTGDDDEIIF